MNTRTRIYLDHAATSWPKPEAVHVAMDQFARQCGAASGRGGYRSAAEADQIVTTTRGAIAALIGAESSEAVSFHSNGTAALNAAIHGVLNRGDHVVTSAAEHNSVLRPLHYLEQRDAIRLAVVPTDENGRVDAAEVAGAVEDDTRLVALMHASNVTGAVQPIRAVGQAIKDHPAIFLCDAAQTFGSLPIDVLDCHVDLLAAPGHKASGGPLGTGFLYAAPQIAQQLNPMFQGGTGSQSESLEMPQSMPSKMEAGNLNVAALAGWAAALSELKSADWEARQTHARNLSRRLHQGLASIPQVRIFGNSGDLPIASIAVEGLSPTDVAAILDAEYGIETRAGMHCAALIHAYLGSNLEGTLRISAGHTSSQADIDAVVTAIGEITAALDYS